MGMPVYPLLLDVIRYVRNAEKNHLLIIEKLAISGAYSSMKL